MGADPRARSLAEVAAGLAAGSGIVLPDGLVLWRLAGGRPAGVPVASDDPARSLVAAMEAALSDDERRRGAHYTPPALAADVVRRARAGAAASVVDPACGGGALLLAAADELAATGFAPGDVVSRLYGADVDPLAVAVAEVAVALWSGGVAPPSGHLVVADGLLADRATWPSAPGAGFDVVVGNPPFQGQLASDTVRTSEARASLRARFGAAVAPYVDTAALFLLAACDLAADGGRVALVQPQSTAASRDGAGVRAALSARARLVEVWVPEGRPFAANVHVCIPVLQVGAGSPADWAAHLARGRGVPEVELRSGPSVETLATAVGGFRRHYYGLVGHVHEGGDGPRLITSGAIGLGRATWGERPIRFAKARWWRPTVDADAVRKVDPSLDRWLDQVLRPKVLLASQTRVLEAAPDRDGSCVPCTPVVSVVPHEPSDVDRLVAALCSPPVAAWAATKAAGTGLSPHAIRTSTALALAAPLPVDTAAWGEATAALAAGDVDAYADAATAMYRLAPEAASEVVRWWRSASE